MGSSERKAFQTSQDILNKRHSGAYRGSWKLGDEKTVRGLVSQWPRNEEKTRAPRRISRFDFRRSYHRTHPPIRAYTHLLSNKQNGTLSSPRFQFDEGNAWIRAIGDKGTTLRYVVWNYPRRGTVYPKGSPDPSQENGLVGIPNIGRGTKVTSRQLPIGITRWKQVEARNLGSA